MTGVELGRDQFIVGRECIAGSIGVDLEERKVPREVDAEAGMARPDPDGLPTMRDLPEEMGGSGETVPE